MKMRHEHRVGHFAFGVVAAVVGSLTTWGCAGGERAYTGKAEAGTTAVMAIDSAGAQFTAAPDAAGAFTLRTPTTHTLHVFQVKGDQVQVVKFAAAAGGQPLASTIPNHEGTVQMGALSTCDCNGDGDDSNEAQAEDNPLDQIDTDDDGAVDAADDDDDGDGERDDVDDDHDGQDGDDAENDDDSDDDGTPDEADHDDDDDRVDDDDAADDHGGGGGNGADDGAAHDAGDDNP